MNDAEWDAWGRKLDRLLSLVDHIKDDCDELRGLADGIEQKDSEGIEALERFSPSGWTFHMGGDWMEPLGQLEDHLKDFEPRDFDAYLKRRRGQNDREGCQ